MTEKLTETDIISEIGTKSVDLTQNQTNNVQEALKPLADIQPLFQDAPQTNQDEEVKEEKPWVPGMRRPDDEFVNLDELEILRSEIVPTPNHEEGSIIKLVI